MHSIEVTPAADRDLDRLNRRVQKGDFERLRDSIRGFASEPCPQGVAKPQGAEGAYRIRVSSYRVVYDIDDDQALVVLLKVVRRSKTTYRR